MRTTLMSLAALMALAACNTPVGTGLAREGAKSVVNDVVSSRFPSVPITPVTDCIIDNADGSELVQIAGDAVLGTPSDETVALVIEIALRGDTLNCFIEEAGPRIVPIILASQL